MAKETKAKGRPKGSPNRDVHQVDAPASRCGKCDSTRRGAYFNVREMPYAGVCNVTGQVYTSIVIRRCECLDCGQFRDDRQLVNEPAAEAA
jgi:hypothetical protein